MNIIRDVAENAKKFLEADEILLFVGARQAGKTFILKQLRDHLKKLKRKYFFLNLEDPDYLKLLNSSPKNLFKIFSFDLTNKSYLFVDEVQYLDNPSNFLKYLYDEHKEQIKILATGSSAFYIDQKFKDSLAGRKKLFNVQTLSFKEFLRFKNETELSKKDFAKLSLADKEKIALYYYEYIIYGGYPRVALLPIEDKADYLQEIAYSYIKKDVLEANIRQSDIFFRLFKILASQTGNLVNASELATTLSVSKTSVDNYLYVMQKSFHLHLVKPYFKNVRKELTKMPKIYFADLGLRNFFTGNFSNYQMRTDKGQILENAFFRQLTERIDVDEINFWRTIDKYEIDFIVEDNKAFEVKATLQNIKKRNYQKFTDSYPQIKITVVTLDSAYKTIKGLPVIEPYEI